MMKAAASAIPALAIIDDASIPTITFFVMNKNSAPHRSCIGRLAAI